MGAISFSNVKLSYGRGDSSVCALDGLTLDVEAGTSVAVIGPSGCGKSSMLSIASGLVRPDSGSVSVCGNPVSGPQKECALILQDFGLLPWKNVLENAALGLKLRHVGRQERNAAAQEALRKVELTGFESSYPSQLSGGMKQRLAMARALAMDASVLLMDEPLSALDALLRERLQDAILNLWKDGGYTQIIVTHSIDEAVFLGQRIVVMSPRPGRIVGCVDNPEVGECAYRSSSLFHVRTNEVREILRECSGIPEECCNG